MNGSIPWFLGNSQAYRYMWGGNWWGFPGWIVPVAVWSIAWTGLALWHAAKRGDKAWFVVFLLVHTAGILEIVYLAFVAKAFNTYTKQSKKKLS